MLKSTDIMAEAVKLETLANYFLYPTCQKFDWARNVNNTGLLNNRSSRSDRQLVSRSEPYEVIMSLLLHVILNSEFQKWAFSLVGCVLVGIAGIFPFFIFRPPVESAAKEHHSKNQNQNRQIRGIEPKLLNCLLSFAVGSLLGDTFLHLLPEAWERVREDDSSLMGLGSWTLVGIISFVICEKLVSVDENGEQTEEEEASNNNHLGLKKEGPSPTDITTGYLNLVANVFDNFTHGLAVAGSFIVSPKVGLLTTAAILLHEIPHEIADFAILLRSGFDAWSAAKAQVSTAVVGLLGAVLALVADSMEAKIGNYTSWILPFTAGCFITISMNNLLPDLMKEQDPKESLKQLVCLLLGISVMGVVSLYHV